jgi:hypothetical protein
MNVLVSALITPAGAPARLLHELRAGAFELIVSLRLLDELRDVLARDKLRRYVTPAESDAYVEFIRHAAISLDDPEPSSRPVGSDPDDEYLIDLARAALADAIVSGDRHLLDLAAVLPVVTPGDFLESLVGSSRSAS